VERSGREEWKKQKVAEDDAESVSADDIDSEASGNTSDASDRSEVEDMRPAARSMDRSRSTRSLPPVPKHTKRHHTAETNRAICNVAFKFDKDQGDLKFLDGCKLRKTDDSNRGRQLDVKRCAGKGAIAERWRPRGKESADESPEDRGYFVELDSAGPGVSYSELDALLHRKRSESVADTLDVGERCTSAVINSFRRQGGVVPPVDFPTEEVVDAGVKRRNAHLSDFTTEHILKIRLHILNKSRGGENVFSKGVRLYAGELITFCFFGFSTPDPDSTSFTGPIVTPPTAPSRIL